MTNPPNYTVGDKVVCIDDSPYDTPVADAPTGYPTPPKQGEIYVVRAVWYSPTARTGFLTQFIGYPDACMPDGRFRGYPANRFRKLEDIQSENAAKVANTQNA